MKLWTKFILYFSLLMLIPLFATTLASYYHYNQVTRKQMEKNAENLFHNAVSVVNNQLDSISQSSSFLTFYSNGSNDSVTQTLNAFREGKEYSSYDVWKASQYHKSVLQNLLISNSAIRGVYIFTPGNIVFSASTKQRELSVSYDPRDDQWYQATLDLAGRYYITGNLPPDMFRKDADSIFFSRSINDIYSHEFLGVLLLDCDPAILNLDHVNPMPDMVRLTIANENTNEVLYTNMDFQTSDFSPTLKKTFSNTLDFAPLELTAEFDYGAMYSELAVARPLLLIIALVCVLCAAAFSQLLAQRVFRPLEELSRTMKNQSDTALTFSNPWQNRTDEIATLYTEYTHMLEQLDASIKRNYKDKLIVLDAQMKSLEARINSHFLFNTLESINSMAELDDNERIATMALALGDMFRYTIKTPSELVLLKDELKHVEDYVSIQRIRFENKFSLAVDIPEELYGQRVLKLMLQPLVENAFYHGLKYCSKGDTITIRGCRDDKVIFLTVTDNGQGIPPDMLAELNGKLREGASFTELGHRTKQSIGLKNVHSRIELYYGSGYGLKISSMEGQGTTVTIRIPVFE